MKERLAPRPNPLPWPTAAVSTLIRAPIFLIATALCGSAALAVSLFERSGRLQHRIAQLWAHASIRASGSSLRVLGAENLPARRVGVYCCNHLSYMDTPAVFAALPFQFRIVARSSLWTVPFIGWYLRHSGQIPVNVENPRASISSLSGGVKTLKGGTPLVIFPEGGRSRDGHPAAFMNGPAFMAIRAGVPLIPMALIGTRELLPMHAKTFRPSPLLLVVGEPMHTAGLKLRDVDAVTEQMGRTIARLYYQHSYLEEPARADLEDVNLSTQP